MLSQLACFAYGAGHEGLSLLLKLGPYRILLDFGLADIPESELGENPAQPWDLVLCSHAHPDHAQGLWALHQQFPQLPIYMSEVTAQLLPLNWPELTQCDTLQFCRTLPWRSPLELLPDLTVTLYPAGHLPGAAAAVLRYQPLSDRNLSDANVEAASGFDLTMRPYTVAYTGDCYLSNTRLVDGLPLDELRGLAPDVLLVDGSYGVARMPHRRRQENQLADQLQRSIAQGHSVLLPTSGFGVAQELLLLLRSHYHFTGQPLEIWVDGAIAAACDAYLQILPHLPAAVQNFARHQPLFWDEKVRPYLRRLPATGRLPTLREGPCIVLLHDQVPLTEWLCAHPERPWQVFYPQSPWATPDSELAPALVPEPVPELVPEPVWQSSSPLKEASIALQRAQALEATPYLLAQHSDGLGTVQLIHNLRPQHVVFVHGDLRDLGDLASLEELTNRYQLHIPLVGQWVDLPVGESFVRVQPPETRYEGELDDETAWGDKSGESRGVLLRLPKDIAADVRWQAFADTGLVEVRWQGADLVLRGISAQELLRPPEDG
jgi:Cft2 family RNA processing exonuclease